jgi:hypothetical protein
MICLLKFPLANPHDVGQILANLIEQFPSNSTFTGEQPIQWVLVIARLLCKGIEFLECRVEVDADDMAMITYRRKLSEPFTTAFKKTPHPCRLLRSRRTGCWCHLVIII